MEIAYHGQVFTWDSAEGRGAWRFAWEVLEIAPPDFVMVEDGAAMIEDGDTMTEM
jgi:hypothetical protein